VDLDVGGSGGAEELLLGRGEGEDVRWLCAWDCVRLEVLLRLLLG